MTWRIRKADFLIIYKAPDTWQGNVWIKKRQTLCASFFPFNYLLALRFYPYSLSLTSTHLMDRGYLCAEASILVGVLLLVVCRVLSVPVNPDKAVIQHSLGAGDRSPCLLIGRILDQSCLWIATKHHLTKHQAHFNMTAVQTPAQTAQYSTSWGLEQWFQKCDLENPWGLWSTVRESVIGLNQIIKKTKTPHHYQH